MAIAVSESALGLGLLIAIFRITKRVDFDNLSYLRG
jgi:NADH:ubiquinone oxidoreductase subunit K